MWALILHGGAKEISPEEEAPSRHGCLAAAEAGSAVLSRGGSAVDAVEAAVRVLEDDPTFNAGYGSALNEDGEVEMCSAVMEGGSYRVGAVSAIRGVRHPVSVARALLDDEAILLTAEGARRFAAAKNLELCDPADLISPKQKKESHDTVGAIALDELGRLAVATSTGGLDGCRAGRVGDSPQPGCGYYVDAKLGAVAFSGDGEHIARMMLAARVIHNFSRMAPLAALGSALRDVEHIDGEAGGIALTPEGEFAWAHNSPHFAVCYASSEMPAPAVYLRKTEELRNYSQEELRRAQAPGHADHHRGS